MTTKPIRTGDPVPWFEAEALAGTRHNLSVLAGRWVVLYFMKSFSDAAATKQLAEIIYAMGRFFNDDHVVFFAVLGEAPPGAVEHFAQSSHKALGFMKDYDDNVRHLYGLDETPCLVVLDPLLRVEKIFPVGEVGPPSEDICRYLGTLPLIDVWAGAPLPAPALVIPHVFEPEFCTHLIGLYKEHGGKDSGFMLDRDGKTKTVINHELKQRYDFHIEDPLVREQIRDRVVRRVVPAMERFFQYRPTRMDRYLVSCYDAARGGHFARHRDNVNMGAQHRRFAVSFNLNDDYEGCNLVFPEFGRHQYRAPKGGAIAFSTGALHHVLPVTRGTRYAFVPFFYGEEESRQRLLNNERLHEGEGLYKGDRDQLFPEGFSS